MSVKDLVSYIDVAFLSELLFFFKSFSTGGEQNDTEPSPSSPLSFGRLKVSGFSIIVTVKQKTGRVMRHPLDSYIPRFIPTVTDASVDIPGQDYQHFLGTKSDLISKLTDLIKSSVMSQILSIIGSADLLRGAADLLRVETNQDFRRTAGVNQTALDTIGDGLKSLQTGFISGIKGLVTVPRAEAQKRGLLAGTVVGLGKAAIGMIANPVSGALDAGAGIVEGVKKVIQRAEVVERVRKYPRAMPLDLIEPNVPERDLAQANFRAAQSDFVAEKLVFFFKFHWRKDVLSCGITTNYLAFFDPSVNVLQTRALAAILSVGRKGSVLTLKMHDNVVMKCMSEETAITGYRVIQSRIAINEMLK
jgi:hypothetical protein